MTSPEKPSGNVLVPERTKESPEDISPGASKFMTYADTEPTAAAVNRTANANKTLTETDFIINNSLKNVNILSLTATPSGIFRYTMK